MRVWSIAVLLSLAAEAGLPAQSTTTSFTLDPHGGIVVAAVFNGAGPYRILLDTGANHSSISEDVARAIGAPRDRPRRRVVTGRRARIHRSSASIALP